MKATVNENHAQRTLLFSVEVSGCKHACGFCWANGHYYPPMDVRDVESILDKTAKFCDSNGLLFRPILMHEVLGHPDALRLIQLFDSYCKGNFEPLPTSGLALSARSDRTDILNGLKSIGVKTLWFTLHGIGETHNRIVHHPDAFAMTTQAVQYGKESGFRCGANILVTKENVIQISEIIEFANKIGLDEIAFGVSHYMPIPRLRKYEAIRPELADLIPHSEVLEKHSRFFKDKWHDLPSCSESHYVKAALMPQENVQVRWCSFDRNEINLICKSNLDLHTGLAGLYGHCHGNLAKEDVHQTLQRALDYGPCELERLFFPGKEIPSVVDLAKDWGNQEGQRIYFDNSSMYFRWLDMAFGLGQSR